MLPGAFQVQVRQDPECVTLSLRGEPLAGLGSLWIREAGCATAEGVVRRAGKERPGRRARLALLHPLTAQARPVPCGWWVGQNPTGSGIPRSCGGIPPAEGCAATL